MRLACVLFKSKKCEFSKICLADSQLKFNDVKRFLPVLAIFFVVKSFVVLLAKFLTNCFNASSCDATTRVSTVS